MKSLLLSAYNQLEIADMPLPAVGARRGSGARGGLRHLRQRCARLRRLVGPAHSTHRDGPRSRGNRGRGRRGRARLCSGRSRHLRLDGLLRRVRLLQARRRQPLRQPPGDRRFLRRLPPSWRVCRVCRGAAAHPLPLARRTSHSPRRRCWKRRPSRCTRCAFRR